MATYRLGKGLQPGAVIGIVAPSAPLGHSNAEEAWKFLEAQGYRVILGQSVKEQWGYLAGSDARRAEDINHFFSDDHIDGILCLRGGYGAARLLDLLDYDMIAAHPKIFIGFSDITALHTVLRERCHMVTIHGPMVLSLCRRPTAYTKENFIRGLMEPGLPGPYPMPARHKLEGIVPGRASGIVTGGNLCLLTSLTGTSYELDGTGSILMLEEVNEEAYAIDRMFRQLEQSGLIDRVKGILFGEFAGCKPVKQTDGDFMVRQVLEEYARRWGKPAAFGLPVGHGRHNGWLPMGLPADLVVNDDGHTSFCIRKESR